MMLRQTRQLPRVARSAAPRRLLTAEAKPKTTANFPPRPVGVPPPKPKGSSLFKKFFYTTLATGAVYTGAAVYASQNPTFEPTFRQYFPYGDPTLDAIYKRDNNYLFAAADLASEVSAALRRLYQLANEKAEVLVEEIVPTNETPTAEAGTVAYSQPGVPARTEDGGVVAPPALKDTPSLQSALPVTGDRPAGTTEDIVAHQSLVDRSTESAPKATNPIEPKTKSQPQQPKSSTMAAKDEEEFPVNSVDSVNIHYEIPVSESAPPAYARLVKAIGQMVNVLNTQAGGASSQASRDAVLAVSQKLAELENHLSELKQPSREALEAALGEQARRFEAILEQNGHLVEEAFAAQAGEFRDKLAAEKRTWRQVFDRTLEDRLEQQRGALYRQFHRLVRHRVDQERGGRLAHLDRVTELVNELESVARTNATTLRTQAQAARINQALLALRSSIDQALDQQQPVDLELATLQRLTAAEADAYPASVAALASVPSRTADEGIETLPALVARFDRVQDQIRRTSLVPEDGGMLSYGLSVVLSKLMFAKRGLVGGEDAEAVLARTNYHLQRADLDSAARELNQLSGWSKDVAQDWIEAARQHLTLKQALQVVESELMLNQMNQN
ncbi:hypothetical protein IWQ60_006739 [Tieghemiomyces parasiticus]|uniref:MICOS complex subunit MIC60 n=2 Tax=Tieghemiomyces parasiticus TaxID=78921 RepID=A0A9W8A2L6_9FUNG|nr:hypothetical protein IWQ60_006739 [Tieghemiomyces parasiticus]